MKKWLALLLMMLLVFSAVLTGCGGTAETSDSEKQDAPQAEEKATGTEGLGDLLSSAYVYMMKSNEYLMKYTATVESEGQSLEVTATVAVSGDQYAMMSSGNQLESRTVMKGDKIYMIDDANKTVTSWTEPQDEEDSEDGVIDTAGITYVGSGNEDGLVYEEYETEDSTIKYYFDGKKLVKMATFMEGQSMVMDILEMSGDVPDSMFEIPAGYQMFEM